MSVILHVDTRLTPATEFRLLTPAGLNFTSSHLGAASCRRPATEIKRVMGPLVSQPCPDNSLVGTGSVTAGLLLNDEQTIFGAGRLALHTGAPVEDKAGLVATVIPYNPIHTLLTYVGYLYIPPAPFGVGLTILAPPIPAPPFGAPVALSDLDLTVGGDSITYVRRVGGRRVSYHPGGLLLPASCPRGAFRFRVVLRFADRTRRDIDAVVPCPPSRR